jgi:hypothetical protein
LPQRHRGTENGNDSTKWECDMNGGLGTACLPLLIPKSTAWLCYWRHHVGSGAPWASSGASCASVARSLKDRVRFNEITITRGVRQDNWSEGWLKGRWPDLRSGENQNPHASQIRRAATAGHSFHNRKRNKIRHRCERAAYV